MLVFFWVTDREWRASFSIKASAEMQQPVWDVIQDLRSINIKLRPGTKVILPQNPLQDWTLYFIAELWYDDPSVHFYLQPMDRLGDAAIEKVDYVFDWQKSHLVLVRSPK